LAEDFMAVEGDDLGTALRPPLVCGGDAGSICEEEWVGEVGIGVGFGFVVVCGVGGRGVGRGGGTDGLDVEKVEEAVAVLLGG
jgi:hypothetical protein